MSKELKEKFIQEIIDKDADNEDYIVTEVSIQNDGLITKTSIKRKGIWTLEKTEKYKENKLISDTVLANRESLKPLYSLGNSEPIGYIDSQRFYDVTPKKPELNPLRWIDKKQKLKHNHPLTSIFKDE